MERIQTKCGSDNDALLASNLEVPLLVSSLSTLAPSLPRVSSIAFPLAGRASRSQSSSFIYEESIFLSLLIESLSYPQVKDNSSIFSLKSLFPMQTDLPMLLPPDQGFPIVSQVLGFDSNNDTQHLLMCDQP